jgi:peptidoglycan/xylan/chitin deacetylase (PgdA/CDA1 family)
MVVPRRTGSWRPLVDALLTSILMLGCLAPGSSPAPTAPSTVTPAESSTSAPVEPSHSPSPSPRPSPTPAAKPTGTARPSATAAPTPAFLDYTVVAGDTLASVAARHATTWQSILYWNRTTHPSLDPDDPSYDPNLIRVGWVLQLLPGVVVDFDAPLPTSAPTPVPTPAATGASTVGTLVWSGSRQANRVALTLDMGGRVEPALAIMTWLRDHGVHATIFMTGAMAESTVTDVGRQVLARIDARPDLFDLGNHSYSHPDMTTLSVAGMVSELQRAEAAIDRYAATSPRPFFRPPFGAWNTTLVNAAATAGSRYTVMWDVDTIDWKPIADGGPTAQQIVDKVVSRVQGGSIILMHLGGYETLEALPGIVSGLQARGFQLVTLGTMLDG